MSDEPSVLSLLSSVAEGECRDYGYLTVWEQQTDDGEGAARAAQGRRAEAEQAMTSTRRQRAAAVASA